MGKYKRNQRSQRKQTRKNAHKKIPENFHRFVWNGTRFASKLEIAWAFFLDGLKVPWEYESHPIFLYKGTSRTTAYTPDFWLPSAEVYLEIKGRVVSREAVERMEQTAQETGHPVVLAQGSPSRIMDPRCTDALLWVKPPSSNSNWQKADLYHCPFCNTTYFHQINNPEGRIGYAEPCLHGVLPLGRSTISSIAGKRIPDDSIFLVSKKVYEL